MKFERTNIVAYGGSIVLPGDSYDANSIDRIVQTVNNFPNDRFVMVIGGGHICRKLNATFQDYLKSVAGEALLNYNKDLLGIANSKINANYVLRKLEGKVQGAYPEILLDPTQALPEGYRVFLSGGWKPGRTTDYVAIRYAETLGADCVYKISNIEKVLDVRASEFDKNRAEEYNPLSTLSWNKLSELVGTNLGAGANAPLDELGAKLGKKLSRRGFKLFIGLREELPNMLAGKKFNGSIVE